MSDETLQAAEEFDTSEENTDVEFSEVEQDESSSDSEPETEGGQVETAEKAPEVEEDDPDRFQKRINQKHFEMMQAQRERDELRQRLEQYERQSQPQRPNVPPPPDPFDDDYQDKVRARDEAIQRAAQYDAQQAARAQQQQAQEYQRQQQQQQQMAESAVTYSERAKKLGVDPQELQFAGQTVAQYGLDQSLLLGILSDDHGPLITKHLASDPIVLDQLRTANPYQAGMMLAQIKAKAAASIQKPKPNPPDPVEPLKGSGARPDDGLPGVVYE